MSENPQSMQQPVMTDKNLEVLVFYDEVVYWLTGLLAFECTIQDTKVNSGRLDLEPSERVS